jgi:hypothetical protein
MKMQPNAVASLIIGPKLTKDRLMQGAGRLRQLGVGQRVVMVSTPDLIKKQLDTDTVDAVAIVHWVSRYIC